MRTSKPLLKSLLVCGALSSLLYVLADLTAAEAAIGIPYNLLMIAFAAGVWMFPAPVVQRRILHFIAVLMLSHAVSGCISGTVFPTHPRGMAGAVIEVLFMLLTISLGALAYRGRFRIYSTATIVLLAAGGLLSVSYGVKLATGVAIPGPFIADRMIIYGFMAWVIVLAVMLLRKKSVHPAVGRMHYIMRVL